MELILLNSVNETNLSEKEGSLKTCEQTIFNFKKSSVEAGKAFLEIRESKLYRLKSETFAIYCREVWDSSEAQVNFLINFYTKNENLTTIGCDLLQNERQARALGSLVPSQQKEILTELAKEKGKNISAKDITEKVKDKKDLDGIIQELKEIGGGSDEELLEKAKKIHRERKEAERLKRESEEKKREKALLDNAQAVKKEDKPALDTATFAGEKSPAYEAPEKETKEVTEPDLNKTIIVLKVKDRVQVINSIGEAMKGTVEEIKEGETYKYIVFMDKLQKNMPWKDGQLELISEKFGNTEIRKEIKTVKFITQTGLHLPDRSEIVPLTFYEDDLGRCFAVAVYIKREAVFSPFTGELMEVVNG